MGPYQGADLHGGLDINMPIGTPLWAPIDFDEQFYFNSLAMGHNNNRWRAVRKWPNGDTWTLQVHHLLDLLIPQHTKLNQGKHYAVAAGELTGSHAHSHFVFKIGPEEDQILLDPWIVFWQLFENNKRRANEVHAQMASLKPAKTGQAVSFNSEGSRVGATGHKLSYYWCFGDGGWSNHPNPEHTYIQPGIYPVTLTVDDGVKKDSFTQHIPVDGNSVEKPALILDAPGEVAFRPRPVHVMDVYGKPVQFSPHTLSFTARPKSNSKPEPKIIQIKNAGKGQLTQAQVELKYLEGQEWLSVSHSGNGNAQQLSVSVHASNMKPKHGIYHAMVTVNCPSALNSPQSFIVKLITPRYGPKTNVIVDNLDENCYVTPYFWLAPRFYGKWPHGYNDIYLMNGHRPDKGEFVRFQPDLAEGTYKVSFSSQTPFRPTEEQSPDIRFTVKVHHKNGLDTVHVQPLKSRTIGEFEFSEGSDGYVDILAGTSKGLVVADAIHFERISN